MHSRSLLSQVKHLFVLLFIVISLLGITSLSAHEIRPSIVDISFDETLKNGIDESYFISNIVNLYQCYFKSIWIDSRIQRLDAEELLPTSFQNEVSVAGDPIGGWKMKRMKI